MCWWKWRLVKEQWATLEEVERHWSILDVHDANRLLDIRDDNME